MDLATKSSHGSDTGDAGMLDAPSHGEIGHPRQADMGFATASIHDIADADAAKLDGLPYGVIGFRADGIVDAYSAVESRMAGLKAERVRGKHLFTSVAPCMNNFMVAHRFDQEAELDQIIDYVLTLRMRPTPVKIRMLKSAAVDQRFLLIQR